MKHNPFFLFSLVFCLMIGSWQQASGQAAILVLIFGDKVASEKFHLSLDAGANYTSMPGLDPQKARLNPHFGLGTFIKINDKWALTPEFKPLSGRSAQGVKAISDYSTTLNDIEYTISANYIDIPVMVQYKLTPRIFVSTGGQASLLIGSRQIAEGKLINGGNDVTIVENDINLFNKWYFTIPFELGYNISTQRGGKGLDLKLRYNLGMSEMISNSAYGSTNGSTFQFIFSFPFVNVTEESAP